MYNLLVGIPLSILLAFKLDLGLHGVVLGTGFAYALCCIAILRLIASTDLAKLAKEAQDKIKAESQALK